MTTFATLITRCQTSLNDQSNTTWTAEQILKWLNDATRDYSQHFPRLKTQTISCADDDNAYDLNADFQAILSVEYPTGEDPPAYLSRLSYNHPDFWISANWYDILPRLDAVDRSELWISADPATGESIELQYHAHHELITDAADSSDEATVPPAHQPLLIKYVLWQAAQHLLFAEQQSPTSNSSLLMAQLSQNARRLEAGYHTALRQALYAADGQSRPAPWITTGDFHARIY